MPDTGKGAFPQSGNLAAAILEALQSPVIVVSATGRLLLANALASEYFAARGSAAEERTSAKGPDDWQRLRAAVLSLDNGDEGKPLWLKLDDPGGRGALLVHLVPLPLMAGAAGGPFALAIFCDTGRSLTVEPGILRQLYGLTSAEAKVASAIAAGEDIAGVGTTLEIANDTVRTHLKSVFRKMGVRRQQELIHLINRIRVL